MLGFLIGIGGIPAAPEEDPDVVEIPVVETLVAPMNIIQYKTNSKLVSSNITQQIGILSNKRRFDYPFLGDVPHYHSLYWPNCNSCSSNWLEILEKI